MALDIMKSLPHQPRAVRSSLQWYWSQLKEDIAFRGTAAVHQIPHLRRMQNSCQTQRQPTLAPKDSSKYMFVKLA
ncbi:UNVERIFIED_CONTAM: hypothetical protein K2H54_058720 [Gekko kuhli]